MFTKWPRTLGLLLLSTSCSHSMADDAYIDRLAFSKNPFVINSRGSIEIAPDFKAFVAAASANKRLEVSGTSLVVAEDLTLLGEFSQSCKVMPANSFFDFVAKQVEKNASSGESVGDFSRFPTWNSVGFDFYAWS